MTTATHAMPNSIYEIKVNSLEGTPVDLKEYQNKVLLIVNTASKCGFTPQYKDLEALYNKYRGEGLVVLGFPSNDFGSQEPGSNNEIKEFCQLKYGVTFPIFEKGPVSGEGKQEIFKVLTTSSGSGIDGEIAWNFEKFLVGKDGKLVKRFSSSTNPLSSKITAAVEELLAK
jgi:glutathione peroxidase